MAIEIENIVANSIVIKARAGDRGRSRKWKEILKLPPVAQSLCLRDEIEHTYEGLIETQPIGSSLFEEFCNNDITLSKCHQFLQALKDFEIVPEEKGAVTAQQIYEDFLSPQNSERLELIPAEKVTHVREKIMQLPVPKSVFTEFKQTVREFLSGQPFVDYVDSHYYWRYLQFKYLEQAPVTKNSFRVYRVLGKGGFGLVHACQSKPTGKMYALKKLEKKRVKKRKGDKLALNEKVILEKVDSRFVVSLAYAYQTKDSLCMVLTLMNGGDLRFHIHNIGAPGLDMERTVFYTAEIAAGLSHLHARRIAYRDMKPDNILLDDLGHVRISDLGLAVHIPEGQSVRGRVGTVGYMAPEIIDNHRYTFSPDWWGLGCVTYEMIHGECPFRKRKERISREKVEERVKEQEPPYSDRFCRESKAFCSLLLEKSHSNRLGTSGRGFEDVKSHNFFKSIDWTHLEQGILEPPFTPNPRAVYAKDVLDIDAFSSIRGVELEEADESFASKFATGAVSKPWQEEMIESKVFADINKMNPIELMTMEANTTVSPVEKSKANWLKKLFRFKKQSTEEATPSTPSPRPKTKRYNTQQQLLAVPTPEDGSKRELSCSAPDLSKLEVAGDGNLATGSGSRLGITQQMSAEVEEHVEDPCSDVEMYLEEGEGEGEGGVASGGSGGKGRMTLPKVEVKVSTSDESSTSTGEQEQSEPMAPEDVA